MKNILKESYLNTKKSIGIDPSKPGSLHGVLMNDDYFDTYVRTLSEGVAEKDATDFRILCENTRRTLLENSLSSINPYETLALPLLRVFYPKTIAKELVTVIPMDKPEIVRGFARASFKRFGDSNTYNGPSNTDISGGPDITVPINQNIGLGTTDILNLAGLNSEIAHIEKSFVITRVVMDGGASGAAGVSVSITPTVDGLFSATVSDGDVTDSISGDINYGTGVIHVASAANKITKIAFSATVSLEENTINPRVKFSIDKMRITAKDRVISAEWSIQAEQDIKALFDVDVQTELVSMAGQQIVLDIDREIVNTLIYSCERLTPASHNRTFDKNPASYSAGFNYGPKQWMENIIPVLNELSASIYTDTNMGSGNVLACNPLDAAIFESLNGFRYTGKADTDGMVGYESATVGNGKWKVLTSSVVPRGKVVNLYKPTEAIQSVFIFAPYVPCVMSPYPLGNTPSLSIISRYGKQLIRPHGIGVLNVIDTIVAG